MNLSKSVFEIAESFMENPRFVNINREKLNETKEDMIKLGALPFYQDETSGQELLGTVHELVGGAINYCYWYGKHTIRPSDARSSLMWECVKNGFFDYTFNVNFDICIERLIKILAMKRFPLLEERARHLRELVPCGEQLALDIYNSDKVNIDPFMSTLVSEFPGYGSDIFLKRASLFFLQLNRRFGWFQEAMNTLHIPADYQVPRLMDYRGILEYDNELRYEVDTDRHIPKWSQKECEIRSATVLIARDLQVTLGWTIAEIDGYFWVGAKGIEHPFHLCVTTDY